MSRRPVDPVVARSTFDALRRPSGRARKGPLQVSFSPIVSPAGKPQAAFAVSKRCGGAVDRNLIRRRLRAALRETQIKLIPGAYLIRTDPEVLELSFQELIHSLEDCLERAGEKGRINGN